MQSAGCLVLFILVALSPQAIAEDSYSIGDFVPMLYWTQEAGQSNARAPYEAPMSVMPRFGMPKTVSFSPSSNGNLEGTGKVTIKFSFEHERLLVPWFDVVESDTGRPLETVILTFKHTDGEVLRVRPTQKFHVNMPAKDDQVKFKVEYRWEQIPEEDEEAAVWLVFVLCLLLTVVTAVEVYNSFDERVEDRSR